jgi:hypothetical protein
MEHHEPPAPISGPLVVSWLGHELPQIRAGASAEGRIACENSGTTAWPGGVDGTLSLSYHWLDAMGNPVVWDGLRNTLRRPVEPGVRLELPLSLRAPIPPGRYRLAVDIVDEGRLWFAELGSPPLEVQVEVLSRLPRRALAVRVAGGAEGNTEKALAAQEEPLVEEEEAEAIAYLGRGCLPAPNWSRLVLDMHEEGYGIVAGPIDARFGPLRRRPLVLGPWEPGRSQPPSPGRPLLCPSIVKGIKVDWDAPVRGLPAVLRPAGEPWLFDERFELRAR